MNCAVCHVEPFGNVHDHTSWRQSSVAIITTMEITSNCLLFVKYFFLGLVVGASLSEPSPSSIICSNWHAKLLPCFPTSSFDHNFGTNDTQTFNVYVESTLVLYRKGLCDSFLERSATSFKDQRKY